MLHSSAVPVFPSPSRPVWPSDRPLISDEEWQALLCLADAVQPLENVHAGDAPQAAHGKGSLS